MIPAAVSRRAQELAGQGIASAIATVVRAQRPTSAEPGEVALVLDDGAIEGFVGGVCAEQSVVAQSLKVIESGESVLLRILPDAPEGEPVAQDGAVTVHNPCLSGGAIEVFIEPVLPLPRVLVAGDTPIAEALRRLGAELGLDMVAGTPGPEDLALVVASHGRDELAMLRAALEADVAYVALVASDQRGAGVLDELRADGVPAELLGRIDVPAGIPIGARTPSEIALSILAKVVEVRRGDRAPRPARVAAAPTAIDPICGMTVAAVAGTPSLEHDGETIYFCCEGCRAKFAAEHAHASAER